MFNLFELMQNAHRGSAMDDMARQFGISPDQVRRTMEALLPAFAMGLQRRAAQPDGFAQLAAMMGSGQYARFFDGWNAASAGEASRQGEDVLARLFGSKDISRAVASQAELMSGVSAEIVKRMMPLTAATLMGGLARSAQNQGLTDVFARFAEMARGVGQPAPAASANPPDPFSAWAAMAAAMLGGSQPAPAKDPGLGVPNPLAAWGELMKAMMGGAATETKPPEPETPQAPNPAEMVSRMFETGREVQQQHLTSLQNIFDTYWGAPGSRR
jgi:hypothetical protein